MAGRAGRRNKDDRGLVIMMLDEKIMPDSAQSLLHGTSEPLNSAFYLSYNMVLNLLRVEEINPEYMLEKSFFQYQNICNIPEAQKKVTETEQALSKIELPADQMTYYKIREQLESLTQKALEIVQQPCNLVPFLQVGRLIYVMSLDKVFGWGVVVNFLKRTTKEGEEYVLVDTLLRFIL